MKTYFFGLYLHWKTYQECYRKNLYTILISTDTGFTTSQINSAGLVKEVKHYEPAFGETANAVSNNTVHF